MLKFLCVNRLLVGVLMGVIFIVVSGAYYLEHIDNEKALEKERNLRLDYEQWHLPEGAKARIGSGTIRTMQYSPDGNLIAVVSSIGVWILDAQTAETRHLLAAHTGVINSISFSPDGQTLVSGSENLMREKTILLWDIETGSSKYFSDSDWTERQYKYEAKVASSLAFSPDGQALASGMKLGDILLWETATGAIKKTLRGHSESVSHISFSADGQTLISASYDGTILIWDLTPP